MPRLPESAVRFTDALLRGEPELVAAAVRYASSYRGDWDVMLAAQQLVAQTGTLPLAVARTVANCARADPRYVLSIQDVQNGVPNLFGNVVPIRGGACPHLPHHRKDCCQKPTNRIEDEDRGGLFEPEHTHVKVPQFAFQYDPNDARHQHDFGGDGYCRNQTCDYEPEQAHDPIRSRRIKVRFKVPYYWGEAKGTFRYHLLNPSRSSATMTGDQIRYWLSGWCATHLTTGVIGAEPPAGLTLCPSCVRFRNEALGDA